MRMWHERGSFRFRYRIKDDQQVKENCARKWNACSASRSTSLICALVIMTLITASSARPHNKTSVNGSNVEAVSTLINDTRINSKERTRILTFPRRPTTSNSHEEEDYQPDIVFPDSLESFGGGGGLISFDPVARIDLAPACAGGGTFCEDIPAYPYKLLRDVLSRSKSATADSVLFGADETPDEIAQRIGEPEENYICGAVDKTVFPKAGKTKNNKWKYIVNQGSKDGYVQGVRVELCISTGKPCDLFGNQPNGYVTSCKQKYIYRKMMSLSEGGQPIPDTFLMPSACCCSYKRDNRFLARFGAAAMTPVR